MTEPVDGAPQRRWPMNVDCHSCGVKLGCVICGEDADFRTHEIELRRKVAEELHAYADREYSGAADMATQERVMRKAASIVRGER